MTTGTLALAELAEVFSLVVGDEEAQWKWSKADRGWLVYTPTPAGVVRLGVVREAPDEPESVAGWALEWLTRRCVICAGPSGQIAECSVCASAAEDTWKRVSDR